MEIITLRSHVGEDGILHLDVPVGLSDAELEITLTFKPIKPKLDAGTPQGKGWPPGFFEETSGCLKDNPLVIDSEGVFDDGEEFN